MLDALPVRFLPKSATLNDGIALLWQHPQVLAELQELFGVLRDRIDHLHPPVANRPQLPLAIHARYTRLEVLAAFGHGSGPTVADLSDQGATGTLEATSWEPLGHTGDGLHFNGSSSSVQLADTPAMHWTRSMTWSAWVRPDMVPDDDGDLIACTDGFGGWQFKTTPDTGPRTFAVGVAAFNPRPAPKL